MSSLWLIKEGTGQNPCTTGFKIAYGNRFRLTHVETGSNLHSHLVRSPLSQQQEVTGFGNGGEGDRGDDWTVQAKNSRNSGPYWKIGEDVFIKHVDTSMYLGSSDQAKFTSRNCGRNCPVMNHNEVFGRNKADSFCYWKTEHGIFLHK